MSGSVWMFSDQIDDEDMDFMRHEFVTYSMASDYYGLGLKPVTRMAHECGAIYKIGRKILIRRSIFEEYLREERKFLRLSIKHNAHRFMVFISRWALFRLCIRRLQHTGAEARCRLIAVNRQILADFRAVIV